MDSGEYLRSSAAGTAGLVYNPKSNIGVCALTNSHVVSRYGHRSFGSQAFDQSGSSVGIVRRHCYIPPAQTSADPPSKFADAGLVVLDDEPDTLRFPFEINRASKLGRFEEGLNREYYYSYRGRRISCSIDSYQSQPSSFRLGGRYANFSGFWLLNTIAIPGPGQSGAIIYRRNSRGPVICGLLFGGIASERKVAAFSIHKVFEDLSHENSASAGIGREDVSVDFSR